MPTDSQPVLRWVKLLVIPTLTLPCHWVPISRIKIHFWLLLDGVYGVDVFNADRRTRQGVSIGDYSEKNWRANSPRGYILSIYPVEEWRVEDGSFTKLREISLGYAWSIDFKVVQRQTGDAYGRNPSFFDSYDGYDPETNAEVFRQVEGIDFVTMPIPTH